MVAAGVAKSAESKVQEAQKKQKSKDMWLKGERQVMEEKRKKKRVYADTIRETVKEIVHKEQSKAGRAKASAEKQDRQRKPAKGPKKNVKFTE